VGVCGLAGHVLEFVDGTTATKLKGMKGEVALFRAFPPWGVEV